MTDPNSTTVGDLTFTIQTDGSIRVEHTGAWWEIDRQRALVALVRDHGALRTAVARLKAEAVANGSKSGDYVGAVSWMGECIRDLHSELARRKGDLFAPADACARAMHRRSVLRSVLGGPGSDDWKVAQALLFLDEADGDSPLTKAECEEVNARCARIWERAQAARDNRVAEIEAERDKLQAALRRALEQNKTDEEWARDAGLTYDAFREVLLEQQEDEISFGRAGIGAGTVTDDD